MITLRGSSDSQDKAKQLIEDTINGGINRNKNDHGNSSYSIGESVKAEDRPAIDWDEVNRVYVSNSSLYLYASFLDVFFLMIKIKI